MRKWLSSVSRALHLFLLIGSVTASTCVISPLGHGKDDTDQVIKAIEKCGKNGKTVLEPGNFNITRKMTWNLENSVVDLHGVLNFVPDIEYWLNANSTYRVVFIQSQASWFVVSGKNFVVDAHGTGGISGNGQPWWEYFQNHTREDGDGRPLSLTVFEAQNAVIRDFHIESPPFWCNAVANSDGVVYDGMTCNATNSNPSFFGQNIVPNTDGIDTYRSNNITLLNWDITCGDDCLAIKGNSTNIHAKNVVCRGGNGIAFGSLGQYVGMPDIVQNVLLEDLDFIRLNASIQPNMISGVYFKSWTATVHGSPPTGGGGGGGTHPGTRLNISEGFVTNVTSRRATLDQVDRPVHVYQTNDGQSGDTPSFLQFRDLTFEDWSGSSTTNELVDLECSENAPCPGIVFKDFNITTPDNEAPRLICINVVSESGLTAPCNSTGEA